MHHYSQNRTRPIKRSTDNITKRELDVLRQLATGKSNKEIGIVLHISVETVKEHVVHLFKKTNCSGRSTLGGRAAIVFDRLNRSNDMIDLADLTKQLCEWSDTISSADWVQTHTTELNAKIAHLESIVANLLAQRIEIVADYAKISNDLVAANSALIEAGKLLMQWCSSKEIIDHWHNNEQRAVLVKHDLATFQAKLAEEINAN